MMLLWFTICCYPQIKFAYIFFYFSFLLACVFLGEFHLNIKLVISSKN